MKLGIFGGGFKPFTMGHYGMLSNALNENDKVILLYGLSGRKKGSDFEYTDEMARQIFKITSNALNRKFGNRIIVVEGKPSPIRLPAACSISLHRSLLQCRWSKAAR